MVATRRFILNVDLDGVCADYVGGLRNSVARFCSVDPPSLGEVTSWDFAACWDVVRDTEHYLDLHHRAVSEDRLFANLDPLPGAAEALAALSDAEVHIRIVTQRFMHHGAHGIVAADTAAWLDRHRIPYRDLVFVAAKTDVAGDLALDDSPHAYAAMLAAGREALIFDQPYNRDLDGPRVRDWEHAQVEILARAERWAGR